MPEILPSTSTPLPAGVRSFRSRYVLIVLLGLLALVLAIRLVASRGVSPKHTAKLEPAVLSEKELICFEPGSFFRTAVETSVLGEVVAKDWGLQGKGTLLWTSSLEFVREVTDKRSDDKASEVGFQVSVLMAEDITTRIDLTGLSFEVPKALMGALSLLGVPSAVLQKDGKVSVGDDLVSRTILSQIDAQVRRSFGKSVAEYIANFQGLTPSISPLAGRSAKYTYRSGQGLTTVDTEGNLSQQDEARLRGLATLGERILVPTGGIEKPDTIEVDAAELEHLLVPSPSVVAAGTIILRRMPTESGEVRLDLLKGSKVELRRRENPEQVLLEWAARGTLYYGVKEAVILEGRLSGDVAVRSRSRDHLLFEQTWSANPQYTVLIFGETTQSRQEAFEARGVRALTRAYEE